MSYHTYNCRAEHNHLKGLTEVQQFLEENLKRSVKFGGVPVLRNLGTPMGNMLRIPPINYWFIYEPFAYMKYFNFFKFLFTILKEILVFHRKLSHYKVSDV